MPSFKTQTRQKTHFRRRGSITIITALGLIMVLGFGALAVDYGLLVADRNRMQRAADAAALAGATQLKRTGNEVTDTYNARTVAATVASQNYATVDANSITFLSDNTQIRVLAATTRTLLFGQVLGISSKVVSATSVAGVAPGGNATTDYVAPIGITWETYNAHRFSQEEVALDLTRQNKDIFDINEMVLFDLRGPNGKSGAHMQDQLTGDEIVPVSIGEEHTTLNSSLNSEGKKLEDGIEILADRAEGAPWFDEGTSNNGNQQTTYQGIYNGTLPRTNPRVIHIIITPRTFAANNGTFNTPIQAYVPVYVERIENKKKGSEPSMQLIVRFLPPTQASDGEFQSNPGGYLAGVHVISLLS